MLTTSRLRLLPLNRDHLDVFHHICIDPHVRRYLWDDRAIDRETAHAVIGQSESDWAQHGYGLWLIEAAGEIIGFTGFRSGDTPDAPELLFALLPTHWHRGYAVEAAQAALRHLFQTRAEAWAETDPPNLASVRVLERIGMKRERSEPYLRYRITAAP